MDKTNRLYSDLAWIWPLWGSVEEYRVESEEVTKRIREFARIDIKTLLDVTCGAGKHDFTLKKFFKVTGLDSSQTMLENAKRLNPECVYIQGDMMNYVLPCQFDSILVNDGIPYIASEEDLTKTFTNAYKHLEPGGVLITSAEKYKEHFEQNETKVSVSTSQEPLITYIENNYDPDPMDTTYEYTLVYLIREKGKLRIEHDFHTMGLFTLKTWRNTLKSCGFEVHEREDVYEDDDYKTFICVKPL